MTYYLFCHALLLARASQHWHSATCNTEHTSSETVDVLSLPLAEEEAFHWLRRRQFYHLAALGKGGMAQRVGAVRTLHYSVLHYSCTIQVGISLLRVPSCAILVLGSLAPCSFLLALFLLRRGFDIGWGR